MKTATAYLLTAILSAANVSAECIEGTREEISPGYVVKHTCDFCRQGGAAIKNINSAAECAAIARDAGSNASTYYAPRKQCIVAKEGGKDLPYEGATFMEKVEEDRDPFEDEDPFQDGLTIAQCKAACNADAKYLSYSANKGTTGHINCYLYGTETAESTDGTWPNFVQYDKRCG
ncbi:hypothetical protein FLONG3_9967 [Fusarium longipes]|uniref:Uncharacterized protein n=1 Tax=Fusarium longipes TaxID=694270 RepID=A0A395RTN7_9HYPO|nr:hypothetical protein FLONG3_9967 [Fusarium longipes]